MFCIGLYFYGCCLGLDWFALDCKLIKFAKDLYQAFYRGGLGGRSPPAGGLGGGAPQQMGACIGLHGLELVCIGLYWLALDCIGFCLFELVCYCCIALHVLHWSALVWSALVCIGLY